MKKRVIRYRKDFFELWCKSMKRNDSFFETEPIRRVDDQVKKVLR